MLSISDLWAQILAAPSDKSLQDQYVEALAKAGDWRVEMFQLASEIERLRIGYFARIEELTPRYEKLLADWRAAFDSKAKTWPAEIQYVKGWPIELTINARDFMDHAAEIVATLPLRHLNLKAVSEALEVFAVPQLNQIASLDGSHQRWSREAITSLANSECLRSLRWLDLSYTKITNAEVEILAAALCLRAVEHLDVGHNPCRNPVDAHSGYGTDWMTGEIVPESIFLPKFGKELEEQHGRINWLHELDNFREGFAPSRYRF